MLDNSQLISITLVLSPVIAALTPLVSVFDVSYKDAKNRFESMGKSLKERKIEDWRYVFLGEKVDGVSIAVSDEHISNVLRKIKDGESLHRFLVFCKKSFHVYYCVLLAIFSMGVIHGFLDLMGWFQKIIEYANNYKVAIIASTILYVVTGLLWLFVTKFFLEKKYEKYLEI